MAKSIKLKNDIYIDSTGIVHNNKPLSECLHEHNVTTDKIVESGRIVDGKKEYVLHMNLGNLPNNSAKTVQLPISLANILITRPVHIWGLSVSTNEYMTETNNPTYFINASTMTITTTNDRSKFTGYAELYFTYR